MTTKQMYRELLSDLAVIIQSQAQEIAQATNRSVQDVQDEIIQAYMLKAEAVRV
ncbi:hypothetical protein [Jeotgalibacillus campisalis]|uniref:Uncharacterized protein n=1 Tax=Jeotgalibacillus campisalis TaxID=220754 RepID=A0A0C2RWQ6_9BACL|nr:hypothetical protein [Jeotgalibacillus campisalis]KIL46194.1 hypothetical protein KR50_28690 [Jeotgalibacillus campisalis]